MNIVCVAGARPNFMKIAPLVRALDAARLRPSIIHTGQHYDEKMSQGFFDELNIPRPDANLQVGSGSHVVQIAEVMKRIEPELAERKPAAVLVVGDVNSTVAATITAVKMGIPVAHVEAGLRSFDRTMPEEINRILTDSISCWLFTSEPSGETNLRAEGIPAEKIHYVGNVMIDTLLGHIERARPRRAYERFGCKPEQYALLTLHRPANVDAPERLGSILQAMGAIRSELPILFLVHPRTRGKMQEFGLLAEVQRQGIHLAEPLGYLDMLSLMDSARLVMTDSGGVQEETTALGVPCLTIRENTERPITIELGSNRLVGWQTEAILGACRETLSAGKASWRMPELWDGHAADRIAAILRSELN